MYRLTVAPRQPLRRGLFYLLSWVLNALAALGGVWTRPFAIWFARRFVHNARVIHPCDRSDGIIVLGFSADRFRQDFNMLGKSGRFRIVAAPTPLIQRINSLFPLRPQDHEGRSDKDARCAAARRRLECFLRELLPMVRHRLKIDCIMTPAVHYEYQMPWAAASDALGLPFIALHKEFTVVPTHQIAQRAERMRGRGLVFPGTRVLVTNQRAIDLFRAAGAVDPARMVMTGLPRMDFLFKSDSTFRVKQVSHKQVVLFSFGHYSGGLGANGASRSQLFSADDSHGFVRLFDEVHGAIGELALKHPDVQFRIKPKAFEPWWSREIDRAIKAVTGKSVDDIANCKIVPTDAPALIRDADVVIGFNSTVLLESRIIGRPTIVPLFAEATGTHSDSVFLTDAIDVFSTVSSKQDLTDTVDRVLRGENISPCVEPERIKQVMRDYLGFDDGLSTERILAAVADTVRESQVPA